MKLLCAAIVQLGISPQIFAGFSPTPPECEAFGGFVSESSNWG
jgi:hypothetical protein